MAVRVTKQHRTVRELRADAAACAECGAVGRPFYDYVDSKLKRPPAFCNKDCWIGHELKAHLRPVTSIEEAPVAKEKPDTRRADPKRPRRRSAPSKKRPVVNRSPVEQPTAKLRHLVAV